MLKRIIVNDIEKAIYKKKFCIRVRYSDTAPSIDREYQTDRIYCIDGKDVKTNREIIGTLSPDVRYIFWKDALNRLHPVRVSMSTKTKNNMYRGAKKFWHLKPESEIMTFDEYYNR